VVCRHRPALVSRRYSRTWTPSSPLRARSRALRPTTSATTQPARPVPPRVGHIRGRTRSATSSSNSSVPSFPLSTHCWVRVPPHICTASRGAMPGLACTLMRRPLKCAVLIPAPGYPFAGTYVGHIGELLGRASTSHLYKVLETLMRLDPSTHPALVSLQLGSTRIMASVGSNASAALWLAKHAQGDKPGGSMAFPAYGPPFISMRGRHMHARQAHPERLFSWQMVGLRHCIGCPISARTCDMLHTASLFVS